MRPSYKKQLILLKAVISQKWKKKMYWAEKTADQTSFSCMGKNGLIATSLAGQNNLYNSFLWTWARIKPIRLRPIPGYFFVLCLVAQSCPTLFNPMDCSPPGSSAHEDSPGQNTGVGSLSLLQWIVPTQESNWGLLHCGRILYQLSYQGSP